MTLTTFCDIDDDTIVCGIDNDTSSVSDIDDETEKQFAISTVLLTL